MATTRKIKEAKDLSSGELIYFKGHAKATYMSDGSTVEDTINNIESKIDLSDYYTKTEIDNTIGDINNILESIING